MKVDVAPLESEDLAEPEARAEGTEQERVLARVVLARGGEELARLHAGERADLRAQMVAGPVVAAEPHGGVPGEEPVLDGLRQDAAEGPADVLDALRAEALVAARGDERPAISTGDLPDRGRADHGEDVALQVGSVDARRAELAGLACVSLEPRLRVGLEADGFEDRDIIER